MVAPQQAKDYIVPLLGILKDFESVRPARKNAAIVIEMAIHPIMQMTYMISLKMFQEYHHTLFQNFAQQP